MKDKIVATKNFVVRHKTPLAVATAVTATTVACWKLHCKGIETHNIFLLENDLYDKFHQID